MKKLITIVVAIILIFSVIILISGCVKNSINSSETGVKKKKNLATVLLSEVFPGLNISVQKIITCSKSDNKCKVTDIKLADMFDMMANAKKNDKEAIQENINDIESRLEKGDKEFLISDIQGYRCNKIEVEKSIGQNRSYEIDYGNHNAVYPGYKKYSKHSSRHGRSSYSSSGSSDYYVKIPQYQANLILQNELLNLEYQYDTEPQCARLCNDVLDKIKNLPDEGYIQVFGGDVNDTPEERAAREKRRAKIDELIEKSKK